MKVILSLMVLITLAQAAPNLLAEETETITADVTKDSDIYLEEIKTICESEAAGLPDADDYIQNCIEIMKDNFSQ